MNFRWSEFLKKYPNKVVFENSKSSAAWECPGKPHMFSSAETFSSEVEAKNTELVNRPALGLSELCSSVETFVQNAKEDDLSLKAKVEALVMKFSIDSAIKVLNQHSLPDLARSSADLSNATKRLLSFVQCIREEWSFWAERVARASSTLVCGTWLLTAASLTIPGTWVSKLQCLLRRLRRKPS